MIWPLRRTMLPVRMPSTIDCGLSLSLPLRTIVYAALVLARVEVLRRAAIVRAEAAAVVPVGAREEPVVAAFAQQRVPHAADDCAPYTPVPP